MSGAESGGVQVADLLARTVATLEARGAHDEALGTYKPSRGLLGIRTAPSFTAAGRAWRLGVLLLDRKGRAFEVAQITRAIEPGRAAVNRTVLGEQRRADRLAASHGPFGRGEVVNFGYRPIDLGDEALRAGTGAIFVDASTGIPMIRWDAQTGNPSVAPLERYLADRLALALGD